MPNKQINDSILRENGYKLYMERNKTVACLDNDDQSFSLYDTSSNLVKQIHLDYNLHQ